MTNPIIMYLSKKQICPRDTLFDLPHKSEPMSAKNIIKKYPDFASIFDGKSEENMLSFYYKKNKDTNIYELIDEDAEIEIAELLGVEIKTFKDTSLKEYIPPPPLTAEQISSFKEELANAKEAVTKHYTKDQ